jgi:hypothetical protein
MLADGRWQMGNGRRHSAHGRRNAADAIKLTAGGGARGRKDGARTFGAQVARLALVQIRRNSCTATPPEAGDCPGGGGGAPGTSTGGVSTVPGPSVGLPISAAACAPELCVSAAARALFRRILRSGSAHRPG